MTSQAHAPAGQPFDVSVVIPTYNGAHRLPRTLDAFAQQRVEPAFRWEVVVVDNNSADRTRDLVERWTARFPAPLVYAFEPVQGANCARNRGIALSRGEIIAFTDDDASPSPDWIDSILKSIHKWEADGVGGRILPLWIAPPPPWLGDRHLWAALAVRDSDRLSQVSLDSRGRFYEGVEIWGANMAFRRSLFSELGPFDPTIGHRGHKLVGGDEVEFVRRALLSGHVLVYDPDLLVWHRVSSDRTTPWFYRRKWFYIGESLPRHTASNARRRLLGVPYYHFGFFLIHAAAWVRAIARRDSHIFCAELELWKDIGFMKACFQAARRQRHLRRRNVPKGPADSHETTSLLGD